MNTEMQTNKKPICCGVLEKMSIGWLYLDGGIKVMPYIRGDDGTMYRVVHCPSCGAYVRDAQIPPETEYSDN